MHQVDINNNYCKAISVGDNFDLRHILEDKTAAYKPCAYTGEGGQQVIIFGPCLLPRMQTLSDCVSLKSESGFAFLTLAV